MVGNSLKASELMDLYEKTKEGCNRNCEDCGMWMTLEKQCYHELEEKWKVWNKKEHERFGGMLRSYEEKKS